MEVRVSLNKLDLCKLEKLDHRWRILREIFRQGVASSFPQDELWDKVMTWGNLYAWRKLFSEDMRAQELSYAGAEVILRSGKSSLCAYALQLARLPCGFRKKFLEGIIGSAGKGRSCAAGYALLSGKYLTRDWIEQLCLLTHSLWHSDTKAKAVIESFFGKRYGIVSSRAERPRRFDYRPVLRIKGFPIFINWSWRCDDERQHGHFREALLSVYRHSRDSPIGRVLLMQDSNGSYAYQVNPQVSTVREALVSFYGLPGDFNGFFDLEV